MTVLAGIPEWKVVKTLYFTLAVGLLWPTRKDPISGWLVSSLVTVLAEFVHSLLLYLDGREVKEVKCMYQHAVSELKSILDQLTPVLQKKEEASSKKNLSEDLPKEGAAE